MSSIEDIRIKFPKELEELLEFEEYPELVTVRGKQFLEPNNFRKVSDIIKSLNGEYVSEGKKSHFKVPRQQKAKPPADVDKGLISEARYYLEQALDRLKQLEKE